MKGNLAMVNKFIKSTFFCKNLNFNKTETPQGESSVRKQEKNTKKAASFDAMLPVFFDVFCTIATKDAASDHVYFVSYSTGVCPLCSVKNV